VREELDLADAALEAARIEAATLAERVAQHEQKQREWGQQVDAMQNQFREAIEAHAAKAMRSSSDEFLKLARSTFEVEQQKSKADLDKRREAVDALVKPISETLAKTHEHLGMIEKQRTESFAKLDEQIRGVVDASWRRRCGSLRCVGGTGRSSSSALWSLRGCARTAISACSTRCVTGRGTRSGRTWW
jgi:DNA recombination protein RmuC